MATYQAPRKPPKPEIRRITDKPVAKTVTVKRPAPDPAPKPIYTDWAMI